MNIKTRLLLLCVITAAYSFSGVAQVITGTILGTVVDNTGSAVPGATVTITNVATNVRAQTFTGSSGDFTAPQLQPGTYEVAVEARGFKTFKQSNLPVTIDSKFRVEVTLAVGEVSETVKVLTTGQALQTDSSDLSTSVSQRLIENLPNIGRNPLIYATTVPGVVPRAGAEGIDQIAVGDDSRGALSNYSVNGSRPNGSDILLDGAPNTNGAFNEVSVLPNLDAIGEFKVITNAYSAEFGRASGGIISFTTKPGTNDFHGSVYETFRSEFLNANTSANNRQGQPRGRYRLNQFGGTFSGPVFLPLFGEGGRPLYKGRDKTFFFVSYEGIRRDSPVSQTFTVPTERERQGDFSQTRRFVNVGGQLQLVPVNIYLPFANTTNVIQTPTGGVRLERQQAPGNIIPAEIINPTGRILMNVYPLPNQPGQADGTNNFFLNDFNRTRADQLVARLDHNFNERHRTFFRFTNDKTNNTPASLFNYTNPDASEAVITEQFNPSGTVGHTWTVSPTSVLELRSNVTRINLTSSSAKVDLEGLGFSREMAGITSTNAWPLTWVGPYPNQGPSWFTLRNNHTTNFSVSGSFTKVLDKWTVKGGGEYRAYLNNFAQPGLASFILTGQEQFTRSCAGDGCPQIPNDRAEGSTAASALLGAMDGIGLVAIKDPALALKNSYWGFYSQNDWKATRKLTLNLGLRWEFQSPLTDRYNRLSQFNPDAVNATGTRGLYEFSGVNGNRRGQTDPDYRNFAPRVGFAYRFTEKSVVRAAYGISYDQVTGVGSGAGGFGTDGFSATNFNRIRPNSGPASGQDILARPFNDSLNSNNRPIDPSNLDSNQLLGQNVNAVNRQVRTPRIQQWNVTIERQLPAGFNVSAAYVGTKGTGLIIQQFAFNGVNSIDPAMLADARATLIRTGEDPLNRQVPNPFLGRINNGNPLFTSQTITARQLALPYPAYGGVGAVGERIGSSDYHAMQLSMQRRFAQNFEVGAYYVWSKSIDSGNHISVNGPNTQNGGGGNFANLDNLRLDRSVANSHTPHRAVINYVLDLPFGKGRRFLSETPIVGYIVGGWRVAGITTFQTGFPLGIGGGGFGRPDLIGDPVLPKEFRVVGDGRTAHPLPDGSTIVVPDGRMLWFNPKAFRSRVIEVPQAGSALTQFIPDVYWFGTSPRYLSNLYGPGVNNTNVSIARDFFVSEGKRFELRADIANIFNRNEFSAGPIDKDFGGVQIDPATNSLGFSTNANFGTLDLNQQPGRYPRNIMLSLRFVF